MLLKAHRTSTMSEKNEPFCFLFLFLFCQDNLNEAVKKSNEIFFRFDLNNNEQFHQTHYIRWKIMTNEVVQHDSKKFPSSEFSLFNINISDRTSQKKRTLSDFVAFRNQSIESAEGTFLFRLRSQSVCSNSNELVNGIASSSQMPQLVDSMKVEKQQQYHLSRENRLVFICH